MFGVGNAAAFCSGLGMVVAEFPSKATALVATLETCFGFGYLLGIYSRTQVNFPE